MDREVLVKLMVLGVAVGLRASALQEDPPQGEQPQEKEVFSGLEWLSEEFERVGPWEEQVPVINQALERVWEQNGWNDESQRFALSLAQEVAAIPPWQIEGRIGKLVDRIGDRYDLNDTDRGRLKKTIYRESLGMLWRNAPVFFKQTREMVELSAKGQPISPELVAEWTRETAPVLEDMKDSVDRLAEQLASQVRGPQRGLLERDMDAFDRRLEVFEGLREAWAQGKWRPQDWGIEHGMLFRSGEHRGQVPSSQPTTQPSPPPHPPPIPHRPETWRWYVEDFLLKYQLNPAQAATAWSIFVELYQRADDYESTRRRELAEVPPGEEATHDMYRPICRIFEELTARLDRIPTRRQRGAARP